MKSAGRCGLGQQGAQELCLHRPRPPLPDCTGLCWEESTRSPHCHTHHRLATGRSTAGKWTGLLNAQALQERSEMTFRGRQR
jgi:hypothetical protein